MSPRIVAPNRKELLGLLDDARAWVEAIPQVLAAAESLHSHGHGPGRSNNPGGSSDISDPTGEAVVNGNAMDDEIAGYIDALWGVKPLLQQICQHGRFLTTTAANTPRPEATIGAGPCQACERWVAGTAKTDAHDGKPAVEEDRRRAGYCEACYRMWLRKHCPDRATFEREIKELVKAGTISRPGSPYTPIHDHHAEGSASPHGERVPSNEPA